MKDAIHGWKLLEKDSLLGQLQPDVDKDSKGFAILILEFDDVMVKHSFAIGAFKYVSELIFIFNNLEMTSV